MERTKRDKVCRSEKQTEDFCLPQVPIKRIDKVLVGVRQLKSSRLSQTNDDDQLNEKKLKNKSRYHSAPIKKDSNLQVEDLVADFSSLIQSRVNPQSTEWQNFRNSLYSLNERNRRKENEKFVQLQAHYTEHPFNLDEENILSDDSSGSDSINKQLMKQRRLSKGSKSSHIERNDHSGKKLEFSRIKERRFGGV